MAVEDKVDRAAKIASNLKTLIGLAAGLVIGAFASGFFLKQQYDDLLKSYNAIRALQTNKWGPDPGEHPSANWSSTANCPDGSYLVGLTTKTGTSVGEVGGLTLSCRRLNLQKIFPLDFRLCASRHGCSVSGRASNSLARLQ